MLATFFIKRFLPFCLGLVVGLVVYGLYEAAAAFIEAPSETNQNIAGYELPHYVEPELLKHPRTGTNSLFIVSKPKAAFTDEARQNLEQGTVSLRVVFLASGEIGSVEPVDRLNYGLTEAAMAAAKQIRFLPATRDGVATSVIKTIEYSFTIY